MYGNDSYILNNGGLIMEYKELLFNINNDKIGILQINSPPGNIMTFHFYKELTHVFRHDIIPSNAKGLVIMGSGRHYSSGADIANLGRFYANESKYNKEKELLAFSKEYIELRATINSIYYFPIPVISAISGICVGGGFELALSSHIRICGLGSFVGLPESTFGLLPGLFGTINMFREIGYGKSLEFILSGEMVDAQNAYNYGLVDYIVCKRDLKNYAMDLLKYIIKQYPNFDRSQTKKIIESFNTLRKERKNWNANLC